ncbi:MAG: excinuclease ABC subunit UvrC [Acidimicrobiales bacterium]
MLERPRSVPDAPGSYQFKDADGRVIYVGKAISLKQRLSNYFGDPSQLHPRTQQMLERARSVEWIQVRSEVEAIMLEYSLIKEHRPHFNVRLVDDKSYPFIAVTTDENWPRVAIVRGTRRKGTRYFGPYAQSYALREMLDMLVRSFPVRSCTNTKFARHERLGRPCLLFHIERCSGPCVGEVTPTEYRRLVEDLSRFLDGDTRAVVARLEAGMRRAAAAEEYEKAARFRDQLESARLAGEHQDVVGTADEDFDVMAIAESELDAAVQVLHVRHGRVVGRQGFVLEKVEDLGPADLVARALGQHYAETPLGVPREVLVPAMPAEHEAYADWLTGRRGSAVVIRVPRRGHKRALIGVAEQNAAEQLVRHRTRRATDLAARARALEELQAHLGLAEAPLRIECYDMSHLQGSDYVGSMVVMEDGLTKRSDYRRFKVTGVAGNDDYGAMEEVLTRRLKRLAEPAAPADDETVARRRRFAYPPQLLLLDGGKGQLAVGVRVLAALGLAGRVAVAALAKQFEEVFVPGSPDPVRIPRDSEAIYLLQEIRDEAHRFAVAYHRELRARRLRPDPLGGVRGLGRARRARLVTQFGSLRAIRAASSDDLRGVSWLPDDVADAVFARLHPGGARPPSGTGRSPRVAS